MIRSVATATRRTAAALVHENLHTRATRQAFATLQQALGTTPPLASTCLGRIKGCCSAGIRTREEKIRFIQQEKLK